ncbi:hypothetical protein C8J27_103181 [Rhodobacter aestuarii]|uniref:Uncharacterized protein n=2 Tax=Rhodobacter aestuarii TaxID=453582 RepID=A0A1N7K5E0_9RHOB|nr:hypothetical protein C8J27_103181 [Rhodobacter aestuarii]SIS56770.1 hypothetical protein SAMN05421580_102253 [Rhodobacter aestuarii]
MIGLGGLGLGGLATRPNSTGTPTGFLRVLTVNGAIVVNAAGAAYVLEAQ